jgi:hypothetical protein
VFLREFGALCVSCVPDLTSRNERDDRSSGIVRTILPIGSQRRELVEQKDLTPCWEFILPRESAGGGVRKAIQGRFG